MLCNSGQACGQTLNVAQRNTQSMGNTLAVRAIGFQAIADVADLDFPRRPTDGASSVLEQDLSLRRPQHSEQGAALREVVCILCAT